MSERITSPTIYFVVLVALVLLTALTVAISFAPLTGDWHVTLGLSIAAVKGSLVIIWFMHAIASPRVTWAVILVAATGLAILIILTYTDLFSRGMVPGMPGH